MTSKTSTCLGWTIALAAIGCFVLLFWPEGIYVKPKAKDAEARQNLHAIQLALERYAVDNDEFYPARFADLRQRGFLPPDKPQNPYAIDPYPQLMPEVKLGQHAPGGVTYVAHYGQLHSGKTGLVGFTLLLYGDDLARRGHRTLRQPDMLPGLSAAQRASIPWDYVLLVLHQVEGKGDVPYTPLPEPVVKPATH